MAVTLYYDGDAGSNSNNGLSSGAPKKSIGSEINAADVTVNVKAGTTVVYQADPNPSSTFTLQTYGGGDYRGTVVRGSADSDFEMAAGTSLFVVKDIIMLPFADLDGTCFTCRATDGTVFAIDNVQLGTPDLRWRNGFYLANGAASGGYGHLRDSLLYAGVTAPFLGGYSTGMRGIQNMVIERNTIVGTGTECISFHDYGGSGHRIRNNKLYGGTEQTIDLNHNGVNWSDIEVEGNEIWLGRTGGIISDCDGLKLRGNHFRARTEPRATGGGPSVWLRGPNSIVENNLFDPVLVTNQGAACIYAVDAFEEDHVTVMNSPTNAQIVGNTFTLLAGTTRTGLSLAYGSGVVSDNIGVHLGDGSRVIDNCNTANWTGWTNNIWYGLHSTFMNGQSWAAWTAAGRDVVGSLNVNPGLSSRGEPAAAYRGRGSNVWRHRRTFVPK